MIAAGLGWLGTVGCFGAYFLVARGRVTATSLTYSLLNAGGGILAGTAAALYAAWPSAVSNFIWAGIGLSTATVTVWRNRPSTLAVVRTFEHETPVLELAS